MEFILISDNKIKVMLTEEDLQEFEIETEELDYSNTETKRMFWDVLSRAKKLTGFDTDGQRVLVQLYPSRQGGCELFVTKIGALCSAEEKCPTQKAPLLCEKICFDEDFGGFAKPKGAHAAFSFDSLKNITAACRRLFEIEYSSASSAYIGEDGRYYLILRDIDVSGYTLDKYSFLFEFGSIESYEVTDAYLAEHAKRLVTRSAVSLLATC